MANLPSVQSNDIESEELLSARKTVAAMVQSLKACTLYPLAHENCQRAMSAAKQQLDRFLEEQDHLRLHIGQNTIFYRETPIHEETPNHGLFAVPMFRDGLEWIEFQRGIHNRELNGFLGTLMRYRTLTAEAEGDIVTALWEENYPHLAHEAKEAVWDAELAGKETSDMTLQMVLPTRGGPIPGWETPAETQESGKQDPEAQESEEQTSEEEGREEGEGEGETGDAGGHPAPQQQPYGPSLADPNLDPALWRLTDEEEEILREMVYEEENFEGTGNVLDVLTTLLKEESRGETDDRHRSTAGDITALLSFLKEEFQTTLEQGQIRLAFKLLKEIRSIRLAIEKQNPETAEHLDGFFADISAPEVLSSLNLVWPRLENIDSTRINAFQQHLLLLHPAATLAFAPALADVTSPTSRQLIMDLIAAFAKTDPEPLKTLLQSADEKLVLELIDLLLGLKEEPFQQMLLRLTEHPSELVRTKALKRLLEKDPYMLWRLFHHIEDRSPTVSGVLHGYLGRSKDKMAESLMLDYLEEGQFKRTARDHILACYKTLGRCGSDHSVGFLEDLLIGNTYKERFGGALPFHREGAAFALAEIGTPNAYKTLKKAGRSFSTKVRQAARQALEGFR